MVHPPAGTEAEPNATRLLAAVDLAAVIVFAVEGAAQAADRHLDVFGVLVVLDAAGLGLFTVSGASKALAWRVNGITAVMLGVLTGIGGGVVRDILLSQVPTVLRSDVYAVAALLGAVIMVVGIRRGGRIGTMMALGAAACFTMRTAAIYGKWNLPTA